MTMGRRGFALVAALWLVVALSAVSLEWSLRARERRLATANLVDEARARALADAGVAHARARLEERLARAADPTRPVSPLFRADPWALPQVALADTVELEEGRYALELRDLGAALHLNRASEEELRRFFAALRVDAGRADRIAQAVLDWRDADDERRGRGAERADYLAEGSPVLPENAPFQRLEELRFVRGMTPEIYERARPFLTLLGTGQVNLNAAGRPVLLALPGITEETAAALVRLREQGRRLPNLEALPPLVSSGSRAVLLSDLARLRARAALETREVEVRSSGWIEGGPLRLRLVAVLARGGTSAFLVWTREG